MQRTCRYPLKFAQAQLILNAFFLLDVPFMRARKPELGLPPAELEALRERVRGAKATVLAPGVPCTKSEYNVAKMRELPIDLTPRERDAVLVALSVSLTWAATENKGDVRAIVGPLNEIEDLVQLLMEPSRSDPAGA